MHRPSIRLSRWLGCALFLCSCVVSRWTTAADSPTATSVAVKVMSFNIRYGTARDGENSWPKRRELVFDVIRKRQPDVVGLQEALHFQIQEILSTLPDYESFGVGRNDGKTKGEYAAVLYRKSVLRRVDGSTFWLSDTPAKVASTSWGNTTTRICTWAGFEHRRTGVPFTLYNVHLDHRSQKSRERAVELVAQKIRSRARTEASVVIGDFNAAETNPAVRYLKGEIPRASEGGPNVPSPKFVDTFRVLHPAASDVGTFNSWRGRKTGSKIDYVLAPSWVRVLEASIVHDMKDGRCPSDHFPVSARLLIPRVRES
ncbi:MAG: endonuclease/exonuclease/phosphatase family protein [Planctomycetota bacterium]